MGVSMYQVLARKYRPRNFFELVGQQHVSKALTSALERGRLHHAYLFTGTRGVGKTTIARILAKCLNCETGVTATPCEQCDVCQAVNEGRFIDLIEIDAASRTKVEDTRELLDNVPYAPTQGRYKVYLIDEVHMLSTHSFNALLKTLEEPPAHVKFLFATTDPQKLPITVISRCLQFTLRPLSVEELHHHIDKILNIENIPHDDQAIWQLAESAQGSVRDSLSLTDQAIAYGQGEIHHQDVKDMLGLIDRHLVYDLLSAIYQNQQSQVAELLLLLRQQSVDVAMVLDQLISTLHELALMQYLPSISLKYSEEINQKIQQLAQMIPAQDLQLYYQIACKGREELNLAVTQLQGFEMCILRLLAFRPLAMNEVLPISGNIQIADKPYEPAVVQPLEQVNTELQREQENIASVVDYAVPTVENEQSSAQQLESQHIEVQDTIAEVHYPEQIVQFEPTQLESDDGLLDVLQRNNPEQGRDLNAKEGMIGFDAQQQALYDFADVSEITPEVQEQSVQSQNIESVEPTYSEHIELESQSVAESVPVHTHSHLTPQQILQIPVQELSGEWTAEKWAYWLEQSQQIKNSPALGSILQETLMLGSFAQPILHIENRYKSLFEKYQTILEQDLTTLADFQQLSVNYVEQLSDVATPVKLRQQREWQAQQQAMALFQQNPTLQQLITQFNVEIKHIDLNV